MARQDRRWEIRRRRNRRKKLAKLRLRYAAARSNAEKEKILSKVFRVAPTVSREQFLATVAAVRPATSRPSGSGRTASASSS